MDILTLDYETYYSSEYSLRRMSPAEYILDPRFQVTGLAVKRGEEPSFWVEGDKVGEFFASQPENVMCVTHNALFDMCIASWHFGWVPRLMVDTLGVSRSTLQAQLRSLSLNSVAEHLGLGSKTDGLANVRNMRREEIQQHPTLHKKFIEYGLNDADLTYDIFKELVINRRFPVSELAIMDAVIRCAVQPYFQVDIPLLQGSLAEIRQEKDQMLAQSMLIGAESKSDLMSNQKFADLLRSHGVTPPMKISGTTGKETYAFAKSDQEFIDLLEHPNPSVQILVSTRMGHKSTIDETRHERFINIGNLEWPANKRSPGGYLQLIPMPLRYGGAHTHRLSGDWKMNVQNLGRGSKLRKALKAPEGHSVVAGDESQVEARFVATLCGQEDLRAAFERGEDVYCFFASDLFGRTITKADKVERWLGKTCLAADTLVLTNSGWLPITNVTTEHKLWDGLEWVNHKGLLYQGEKEIIRSHGVAMTGDHEILTEHGWQEWSEVHTNHSHFQSALNSASLPSLVGSDTLPRKVSRGVSNLFADALVGMKGRLPGITCHLEKALGVINALRSQLPLKGIGNTRTLCPMTSTGRVYSTDFHLLSPDAVTKTIGSIGTMVAGGLQSAKSGGRTGLSSLSMSRPYRGGTTQTSIWTGLITTRVISRGIYASLQYLKTCLTGGRYGKCKSASTNLRQKSNVYDLADAGPRHRFTILTDDGPILVHNCILGLGFGLGHEKFGESIPVLSFNQLGSEVPMPPDEAQRVVGAYRGRYPHIAATWKLLNTAGIHALSTGNEWQWGPVVFRKEEIILPNGMKLYYHNLRQQAGGRFGTEWVFDYAGKMKRCYGGMLLENIVQSLARIVVMDAMLRIRKRLENTGAKFVLQVHDELVFVVPDEYVEVTRQVMEEELRRRPDWLPSLPLDCEVEVGKNYGDAK